LDADPPAQGVKIARRMTSSDHNRFLSVTLLRRLFIGVLTSRKHTFKVGEMAILVIANNPRRVLRIEFVLLCE